MDELLTMLEELTQRVVVNLEQVDYEQLHQFVKERQELVDLMSGLQDTELTKLQSARLVNILDYDRTISNRMVFLKEEAGNWLSQRQMAKFQQGAYETRYVPDSILMDYKK